MQWASSAETVVGLSLHSFFCGCAVAEAAQHGYSENRTYSLSAHGLEATELALRSKYGRNSLYYSEPPTYGPFFFAVLFSSSGQMPTLWAKLKPELRKLW